jgi:hypothetical protein
MAERNHDISLRIPCARRFQLGLRASFSRLTKHSMWASLPGCIRTEGRWAFVIRLFADHADRFFTASLLRHKGTPHLLWISTVVDTLTMEGCACQ